MANLITTSVKMDGPRKAIVVVTVEGDGSGEMNLTKIIDTTNDIFPIGRPTDSTINQIWWANSYFDAFIYTNDLVPQLLWVLPVGSEAHVDFRSFGGLKITKSIDGNGDLLMSTSGFAMNGSKGSFIFELKKD